MLQEMDGPVSVSETEIYSVLEQCLAAFSNFYQCANSLATIFSMGSSGWRTLCSLAVFCGYLILETDLGTHILHMWGFCFLHLYDVSKDVYFRNCTVENPEDRI